MKYEQDSTVYRCKAMKCQHGRWALYKSTPAWCRQRQQTKQDTTQVLLNDRDYK